MSKKELIISLLKSKQSIAELFSNNLDDDKISDIKRIYPKNIERKLKKIFIDCMFLSCHVRVSE